MPRRSNLFQDVVALIHEHMAEGASVEESAMLTDRVTGDEREVDVVIRSKAAGHEVTVGIEATAGGRKATVEWVEKMLGKHRNLPTDKLVLVSGSGFSQQAKRKAEAEGAAAFAPEDLAGDDPAFKIVNRLRSIWPKTLSLTPESGRIFVVRPGETTAVWFRAAADHPLFFEDHAAVGGLWEVMNALVKANFERVAEQIGLADIAEDTETMFTLRVGPGWTVEVNDAEQHLYVRLDEPPAPPEFHRVEAVEITGRAVIHVSEVSLKHHRLGEVAYAYGEGKVIDKPALVVVTEASRAGR